MTDIGLTEVPYPGDSADLFERLLDLPWCVFLDSGHPAYPSAQHDILAADPVLTLMTYGPMTRITSVDGTWWSSRDPFALIREELSRRARPATALPFSGGAIGYFAYDLAHRIERLPEHAIADLGLPDMAVGLYDWAIVVDHGERRAWLTGTPPASLHERLDAVVDSRAAPFEVLSELETDMDGEAYANAFDRVQRYIRNGDCYQVNLARRFSTRLEGDAWSLYRRLRCLSPAPYGAYLQIPEAKVLSASPERFLRVFHGVVETRPIKGTRPRSPEPKLDQALVEELRSSPKDRAENIMIVDLLRNDLGKSCATGSIQVPRLLQVESFSNVHHLVSTVTGRLATAAHATDLLRGCFPGGSVTGAPKLRAMEIIDELEPHRRSVYCGAIGYLGYDGNMDTNVAIRTMVLHDGMARFWAGGGLVADSNLAAENQEILDKAQAMLSLLRGAETMDTRDRISR